MAKPDDAIHLLIPLMARQKNGRPKILPPATCHPNEESGLRLAHPARNWPRMGMAAPRGGTGIRHSSGIRRSREAGRTPCQRTLLFSPSGS